MNSELGRREVNQIEITFSNYSIASGTERTQGAESERAQAWNSSPAQPERANSMDRDIRWQPILQPRITRGSHLLRVYCQNLRFPARLFQMRENHPHPLHIGR